MQKTKDHQMTKAELKARQIRDPATLVGKTIASTTDEGDGWVIIVFTDGTFVLVDLDPEESGVGFSLDAWQLDNATLRRKLSELLTTTPPEIHPNTQESLDALVTWLKGARATFERVMPDPSQLGSLYTAYNINGRRFIVHQRQNGTWDLFVPPTSSTKTAETLNAAAALLGVNIQVTEK